MMSRSAVAGVRALAVAVLAAPLVLVAVTLDRSGAETIASLHVILRDHVADLRQGRITESFAITLCVGVMTLAWLRLVWTAVLVVVSHQRSHDQPVVHRPLARILLRVLLLAPATLNIAPSRVAAFPGMTSIDAGTAVESRISAKGVLLVSTAVAVGVSWRMRQRRLAALRADEAHHIVHEASAFESDVVRHGQDIALARVEAAVRSLISSGECDFRWLVQHESGLIHVECSSSHAHPYPWVKVSDRIQVLDAGIALSDTADVEGNVPVRTPVLLPVGSGDAGNVWVNLETVGSFSVIGRDPEADAVWAGLCQSLALSPLHMSVHLIGFEEQGLQGRHQLVACDASSAQDVAAALHCAESPSVLFVREGNRRTMSIHGARPPRDPREPECGLRRRGEEWMLMPMQSPILPTMCRAQDRETIDELLGDSGSVVRCDRDRSQQTPTNHPPQVGRILEDVSFIVRVMGRPFIEHIDHGPVVFERSRSEELVVWLALHPDRRTRSSARADMWNVPVKDATFSNITSDVRRSLTAREFPVAGEQWLSVTLTDDMPLHSRIVTDVDLLESCLAHARRYPEDGGADVLAFGLEFVRGCPLEGSRYLWRDSTGMSTSIAMLVVRAATLCAEMALERGDVEAVYWSTDRGLRAVPGHEGLVSLRMRQHAVNGDTASLQAEWESYCRSLMTDDWGDARPSQKMADLWSSLSPRDRDGG